jgi:hypothetical protein
MSKKALAYVCLALAALATLWFVGGIVTAMENNLTQGRGFLSMANTNVPLLFATVIVIAILILVGWQLLRPSRRWLGAYGGFLACLGLFVIIVQTIFPRSLRIDIRAMLSIQAYTLWLGLVFLVVGAGLFARFRK